MRLSACLHPPQVPAEDFCIPQDRLHPFSAFITVCPPYSSRESPLKASTPRSLQGPPAPLCAAARAPTSSPWTLPLPCHSLPWVRGPPSCQAQPRAHLVLTSSQTSPNQKGLLPSRNTPWSFTCPCKNRTHAYWSQEKRAVQGIWELCDLAKASESLCEPKRCYESYFFRRL